MFIRSFYDSSFEECFKAFFLQSRDDSKVGKCIRTLSLVLNAALIYGIIDLRIGATMNFIIEDLDWRKILIRRYKSYKLDERDLAVLFLINELNRGAPHLVTSEEIAIYTTIDAKSIDSIMSKLLKYGYLSLIESPVCLSIEPLKEKIFNDTMKEVKYSDLPLSKDQQNSIKASYSKIVESIGRPLSSLEFDMVTSWEKSGITEEELELAVVRARGKKSKVNIASIHKQINNIKEEKKNQSNSSTDKVDVESLLKHPLYRSKEDED